LAKPNPLLKRKIYVPKPNPKPQKVKDKLKRSKPSGNSYYDRWKEMYGLSETPEPIRKQEIHPFPERILTKPMPNFQKVSTKNFLGSL
jgi:hypothetical protein